ncbi:uncharacterized protein MCAP_0864-like [Centruroides vittatus]|uniref:uncharacterized protein MCAP_0864-like n=1 Tax=Centruroides vittatus TaxID=120091 RepID=UPI00350FF57A
MQRSPAKRGRPPLNRTKPESRKSQPGASNSKLITDFNLLMDKESQEPSLEVNNQRMDNSSQRLQNSPGESNIIHPSSSTNSNDTLTTDLWYKISELINTSNNKLSTQMESIKEDLNLIHETIRENKIQFQRMDSQIENLKLQIDNLKSGKELIQYKMDTLINDHHYNNIIIYNYPTSNSISKSEILKFINSSLNLPNILQEDILDITQLTKSTNSVIRISLSNKQTRDQIFNSFISKKQQKLLENWGNIQIASDLTKDSRKRRKNLLPIYFELRKQNHSVKLRNDILQINRDRITFNIDTGKLVYVDTFLPFSTLPESAS